ncbi:MAG: phosphotransferase, partial [Candidatus Rokuibacteriota bacterium]
MTRSPATDEAPAEVAPVRPGEQLDWAALGSWLLPRLAELLPAAQGPLEVLQFPNGSANLTYLLRVGPRELVLRRPPFGQIAPGAHDMKREFKVLSRLWRHFDRAPRGYLFCDDPAVLGADFFVMERRRGEVVRDAIPPALREHRDAGRR